MIVTIRPSWLKNIVSLLKNQVRDIPIKLSLPLVPKGIPKYYR